MQTVLDEGSETILLNGRSVRKQDIPLGKEYVERGHIFQALTNVSTYESVPIGGRFRYGDQWFYRDQKHGAMQLQPNMPFGQPYWKNDMRHFMGAERVSILEVTDRGAAQK